MTQIDIQNRVRDFVVNELLQGQDRGLDESTPLLDWGIIDSLSLMTLVSYLEDQFSVRVPDEDIGPDNFGTLKAVGAMVVRLKEAARQA